MKRQKKETAKRVNIYFHPEILKKLDEMAKKSFSNRSEMIKKLILKFDFKEEGK